MLWSTAEGEPKIVSAGWSETEGRAKMAPTQKRRGRRGGKKKKNDGTCRL